VLAVPCAGPGDLEKIEADLKGLGVDEVIHCGGCLDHLDLVDLVEGNVNQTRALVNLAKRLGARRFIYLSSAFSAGFTEGPIAETQHFEPKPAHIDYFRAKWQGEQLVVASGIPFLIVRPSTIVGSSTDGIYTGGRRGIYQIWSAAESFLCREYQPELHVLASRNRVHLVHQDAFQAAFQAAYRELPARSFVHIVSDEKNLPTMRELHEIWIKRCLRPREVIFYNSLYEIPLEKLNHYQKAFLDFTAANLDAAAHRWEFDSTFLSYLKRKGLAFADASLKTMSACQERFVSESPKIQRFLAEKRKLLSPECAFREGNR
jgi:nucleoside-diphosphate-sugar epimerase